MFKHLDNEKGVSQIIVVVALSALIGASALVIDVGSAMAERIKLSNAVDAAALAGGLELPVDPDAAIAQAEAYIVSTVLVR